MELDISTTEEGRTLTLAGHGELDYATLDTLTTELDKASREDVDDVIVDLRRVTYIDSSGLGVLVGAHRRLKGEGRSLVLRVADPEMIKLLAITGLDQFFAIETPYEAPEGGASPDA
ncbi:anti-sigma factor antagonist [soil metagenome]